MDDGRKTLDELRHLMDGDAPVDGGEPLDLEEFEDSSREERGGRRRSHGRSGSRGSRRAERAARKAIRMAEKAERKASRLARSGRRHGRGRKRRESRDRSPEERAQAARIRLARRRANQRLAFLTHAGTYAATLALLLVATRSIRVVMIVALGWGIGVFCHYLWALAAPRLRDRWVEAEVGQRSERSVKRERRQVGTRSRRSLEDLSASIAHEIRNPITAAKSLVQQMGEDPASDENLEYAGLALSELDRVERSISHLLRYARDEEPRFESTSLRDIAEAAAAGLLDRARALGIDVQIEFDGVGEMRGDPEKLRRVVENLMANAIEALAASDLPMRKIELLGGENLAGNELWLRVIDNGPGIPADERERIWSPFFTTKDTGTGLGLALCRKTVEAHGGTIEVLSDPRQGSEFVLSFPKDPAPADRMGANHDLD